MNSSYLSPSSGTEDPADRVNDGNSSGRSSNSGSRPASPSLKMEMTRINNADTQAGGEVAAVAVAENPAQRREEERVEESEERELMLFRHLFLCTQLLSFVESQIDFEPFDKYLSAITFEEKVLIHQKVGTLPLNHFLRVSGRPIKALLANTEVLSSQEGGSQSGKHSTTNDANKAQQTNPASLKWSSNGPLESSLEGIMDASANTEESSDYSKKRASKRASIFSFLRGGNSAALKELASDKDEGHEREGISDSAASGFARALSADVSPINSEYENRRKLSALLEKVVGANQQCKRELKECLIEKRMNVLCGLVKKYCEGIEEPGGKQSKHAKSCANLQIHLDVAISTSQLGKSLVHDGSGTRTESSSPGRNHQIPTKDRSLTQSSRTWFGTFSSNSPQAEVARTGSDFDAVQEQVTWLEHVFDSVKSFNQHGNGFQDDIRLSNEHAMTQPIKQHFLEQLRDNAGDILIETSETSLYEEETEVEEPIHNILRTLIGHLQVDLGMHNEALSNLDSGGLSSQEKFLICITKEFVLAIKDNSFSPTSFLAWAASKGNVSALHAYRLLVHFMHESYWNQYTYDNKQEINEALSLNTGGSATVIRNRYNEGVYGNGPGVEMKGKHDNNDSVYTWIENPENEQSTKILNKFVTCTGSTTAAMPCGVYLFGDEDTRSR